MRIPHPGHFAIAVCMLVIGAVAIGAGLDWYDDSRTPRVMQINDVQIHKTSHSDYLLEISSTGPPSHNCVRVTQHVLYQDSPGSVRRYVPLASALNGIGFGSVAQFTVTLEVPGDLTGDWNYVSRSVYFCTVWPGLLSVHESVSSPYIVSLQPHSTTAHEK